MSGGHYPDWVGIAAGLDLVLLFGRNALLLVEEDRLAKRRECILGQLDAVEAEMVGTYHRSLTHAKVRYSYEVGGSRFSGIRVSVLDVWPVVWAAEEKQLVVRFQEILKYKLPLRIYIDHANPHDAVLVQYPLLPYIFRDIILILFGMGLLVWLFLSGVTAISAGVGTALGLAFYLFVVRRRENPI